LTFALVWRWVRGR